MMSTLCSKHVEAWNKLIVKQSLCINWLITKITILRCTVSKTSKSVYIRIHSPSSCIQTCSKYVTLSILKMDGACSSETTYYLHLQDWRICNVCLEGSATNLKVVSVCSSEKPMSFYKPRSSYDRRVLPERYHPWKPANTLFLCL